LGPRLFRPAELVRRFRDRRLDTSAPQRIPNLPGGVRLVRQHPIRRGPGGAAAAAGLPRERPAPSRPTICPALVTLELLQAAQAILIAPPAIEFVVGAVEDHVALRHLMISGLQTRLVEGTHPAVAVTDTAPAVAVIWLGLSSHNTVQKFTATCPVSGPKCITGTGIGNFIRLPRHFLRSRSRSRRRSCWGHSARTRVRDIPVYGDC
jgi:hypothetical protein